MVLVAKLQSVRSHKPLGLSTGGCISAGSIDVEEESP